MIMTTVLSLSVNLFCFVGFSLSLVTSLVFWIDTKLFKRLFGPIFAMVTPNTVCNSPWV